MRFVVPCLIVLSLLAGCSGMDTQSSSGGSTSERGSRSVAPVVPRPAPPPAPIIPLPPAPLGPAAAGKSNCHWTNSLCQVQECKALLQSRATVAGAVYADLSLARPTAQSIEVRGIAVLAPTGRDNAMPFLCSRTQGQPMTIAFGDRFDWNAAPRP